VATILLVRTDDLIERHENVGMSMGNALRSILHRLAAYLAVALAAGLLFLAGATFYELMWPRPVVPLSQMSNWSR